MGGAARAPVNRADLCDMGRAPCASQSPARLYRLAGREHGRAIPLPGLQPCRAAPKIAGILAWNLAAGSVLLQRSGDRRADKLHRVVDRKRAHTYLWGTAQAGENPK